MKKVLVLAMSLFLTSIGTTAALAQNVEFRGTVIAAGLTQACIDEGWGPGTIFTSRFRPGGIGDNPRTGIALLIPFYGEGYRYDGPFSDLTQGSFVGVTATGLGSLGPFDFDAQIKVTSVRPANIQPTTNFLTLIGKIKDFDGISGCTMSFRGSFNRRL